MQFTSSLLSVLSLAALAFAAPQKRAAAQVVYSCTEPNTAALTFDDGPYYYMYDISKQLVAAGAKGTFFVNGDNYGCIYDADNQKRIKYLLDKGHQLASHTWDHSDLTTLSWDELHDSMWKVEQALQRIAGVVPAFMRPPYGNTNDQVAEVSGIRGQTVVIWDVDSGDSVGASVAESKATYDDILSQHPDTILALNHETYETTAHQVVPYAIQKLQAAGYKLVTVAECLGEQPYQSQGAPQTGTWTC